MRRCEAGLARDRLPRSGPCGSAPPPTALSSTTTGECLGRRYVDPPWRAGRKNLKGDQYEVHVSFIHDDVRVLPAFVHESGAGGIDRGAGIIAAILGRIP